MKLRDIITFVIVCAGIVIPLPSIAQVHYYKKIELCYWDYGTSTVQYDINFADPGWKGPPLNSKQNAIGLSAGWGLSFFKKKLNTGLGLGYLNFEGTNGGTAYTEVEFKPLEEQFGPLINIRLGYSHIWNQYDYGSNSMLSAFEGGFYYQMANQHRVTIKTGILFVHEASFLPISLGFIF